MHIGQASPTPISRKVFMLSAFCGSIFPQLALPEIDTQDRWQVREFFQTVYQFGDDATMQWSGNYDSPDAGSVSEAWLKATQVRVNFYRQLAGVPTVGEFDSVLNAKCQASALMQSMNISPDLHELTEMALMDPPQSPHEPPESWIHDTPDAREAARGNLAWNQTGPGAIDGYMVDFGGGNAATGHRRWVLYPPTSVMGSGDTPGSEFHSSTNTLWWEKDDFPVRPDTREEFVAWPPKGYIPSELVWSRWSFSVWNADFSSASVEMSMDGDPINIFLQSYSVYNDFGESSIVWAIDGMSIFQRVEWDRPETDEQIDVTIHNVQVDGQFKSYNYAVKIFDSTQAGDGEMDTMVETPGVVIKDTPTLLLTSGRPWAEGIQGRSFSTVPLTNTYDAETSSTPLIEFISDGYQSIATGRSGNNTKVYHLAHPNGTTPQTLAIPDQFFVEDSNAKLTFESSLSWASDFQYGSVDINLGEGYNWQSVWVTQGPATSSFTFDPIEIDLSQWMGRTIRIRFRYDFAGSVFDPYYPQSEIGVGWAFDNIAFTGASVVSEPDELPFESGKTFFLAEFTTTDPVYIQGRERAFEGFNLAWGPVSTINPVAFDDIILPALNEWGLHPVLGNLYRANQEWSYSPDLGWLYTVGGIWLWDGSDWMRYIMGDIEEGIWFYSPTQGFYFTGS